MTGSERTTLAQCRCGRIRELNDRLRTQHEGGRLMVSRAVAALGPQMLQEIFAALRAYHKFDAANDPYGEHDMGDLEIRGLVMLWKIDYYDLDIQFASSDPSDPDVTARVLTVMRAEDY